MRTAGERPLERRPRQRRRRGGQQDVARPAAAHDLPGAEGEHVPEHRAQHAGLAPGGGERRRVEIARALAAEPRFILLDEPLAGIDPVAVADIRNLVAQLKEEGIGVLITDHNVRDTLDIIDRAYILHEGHVLMEGAPDKIVADEGVRRVYLGERFSL